MRSGNSVAALLAACGLALPVIAHAQAYPSRSIRLVVASSPGSGVDIVARIVSQRMSETLGAQMIVDNRPGAGGIIGVQNVAKSAADGYTLLMAAPSFTIFPSLVRDSRDSRDPPYDAIRDFAPVGQVTTGNSTHLAAEYFKSLTGIDMVHVPYKGSGIAVTDLIAGRIRQTYRARYRDLGQGGQARRAAIMG